MSTAQHFEALTNLGLKVIPLYPNSKAPMCKNWNKNWNKKNNLYKIKNTPNANIGLLLGDIIDVEGDSDEANLLINDLIGDYPHPVYCSTKSTHHLFLNPEPGLTRFEWKKIEFRGFGHQSVLPPSKIGKIQYFWKVGFSLPVPSMPKNLLDFFYSKYNICKNKNFIKSGHIKTRCFFCEKSSFVNKKRHDLELIVFKTIGQRWHCNKCRKFKIQSACRLVRAGIVDPILIKEKIN